VTEQQQLTKLFEINPLVGRQEAKDIFAQYRRVQIRDVLTLETATLVRKILAEHTPWGMAWQGGKAMKPQAYRREEIAQLTQEQRNAVGDKINAAMRSNDYAFAYSQFRMLDAYLGKWHPNSAHDILIEHLNDQPFLDLVREVTGIPQLIKADAQATLYQPGQFLALHNDGQLEEGWRVAYVLSMAIDDWRPDWGGYLNFYDDEQDIVAAYKPRFNALNLFAVPMWHSVSLVAPSAPQGRFSISGWFRDR
jgi:SM-20-related protein